MAGSATVGILRVLLTANTAEFDSAMKRVSSVAGGLSKDLGAMGRQATALGASLTKTLTVPLLGLGVVAAKLAMDFESSFANVGKTVDGVSDKTGKLTKAGAALAQTFRQMAKEIPATTDELLAIAAIGGQMGVPIQQLEKFTKHVAALGVAVDGISAEDAAKGLAQIANVFGDKEVKNIDKMSSALVHLGNSSNATEGDILEFAKRLSGAGMSVGMTIPEVMALGTAMADVGINAEAGGTAMSTVINKISKAVSMGGESLDEFAKVAGRSANAFAAIWRRSPVEAMDLFVKGLSTMKQRGVDLNLTMGELGTEGIRVADTLKRLAGAGDGVSRALETANEGYAAGNKHLEEAEKKYATTWNQLKLLGNQFRDVGMTLGNALLPTINLTIKAVGLLIPVIDALARGFNAMPTFVQAIVVGFGLLVAATGPAVWVFGQLTTSLGLLAGAFATKGLATKAATASLGPLTAATIAQTVATRAAAIANALFGPGMLVINRAVMAGTTALTTNTAATYLSATASRIAAAAKALFGTAMTGAALAANGLLARLGATTAGMYASATGARVAAIGLVGLGTAMSTLLVGSTIIGLLVAMGAAIWKVVDAIKGHQEAIKQGRGLEFLTARDEDNFVRRALGMKGSADSLRESLEKLKEERSEQVSEQITGANLSSDMAELTKQVTALAAAGELTPPMMKRVAEMAGQIKAQHQELSPVLQSVVDAYSREAVAAREAAQATDAQTASSGGASAQLAKTREMIKALTTEQRKAIVDGDALTWSAKKTTEEVNKQWPALNITEEAVKLYTDSLKGTGKAAKDAAKDIKELTAALDKLSGKALITEGRELEAQLKAIGGASGIMLSQLGDMSEGFKKAADAARTIGEVVLAKHFDDLAAATNPLNETLKRAGVNLKDVSGRMIDTVQPARDADAMIDQFHSSIVDANGIVTRFAGTSLPQLVAELERLGTIDPGFEMDLTKFTPLIPGAFPELDDLPIGDQSDVGRRVGQQIMDGIGATLKGFPALLVQAFTGGGGVGGAFKALGVQLAEDFAAPLMKKFLELKTSVGKLAAGLKAGAAAGLTAGIGAAIQGGSWKSQLGTVATAALSVGAAAAVAAGATVASVAAVSAMTLGVGAAVVGVGLLIRHFTSVTAEVKQARLEVEEFSDAIHETLTAAQRAEAGNEEWRMTVIAVRDAYLRVGRTAAEAEAIVAQMWDTDRPDRARAAMEEINRVMVEMQRNLDEADSLFGDLFSAAEQTGLKLDSAFLPGINRLEQMGLLTREQADALRSMTDDGSIDLKRLQQDAQDLGIDFNALGPKFRDAKLGASFEDLYLKMRRLIAAGGDMGTVLSGSSDEISTLVIEAKKFGTSVPAQFKPWIENLIAAGKLIGEDGQALKDMSGINFGDPIVSAIDKMTAKLQEFLDRVIGSIDAIPDEKIVRVGVEYDDPGFVPRGSQDDFRQPREGDNTGFATGTKSQAGWFKDFGKSFPTTLHGSEAVVPKSQAVTFAMDVMKGAGRSLADLIAGMDFTAQSAKLGGNNLSQADMVEQVNALFAKHGGSAPDKTQLAQLSDKFKETGAAPTATNVGAFLKSLEDSYLRSRKDPAKPFADWMPPAKGVTLDRTLANTNFTGETVRLGGNDLSQSGITGLVNALFAKHGSRAPDKNQLAQLGETFTQTGAIPTATNVNAFLKLLEDSYLGLHDKMKLPRLAEGGIIDAPTLAVLGERGPEMVVPLPSHLQNFDGNTTNERTLVLVPIQMTPDMDADDIASQTIKRLASSSLAINEHNVRVAFRKVFA